MQTKEILSSRNWKQMKPQSCHIFPVENSRLVRVREIFKRSYVLIKKEGKGKSKSSISRILFMIQEAEEQSHIEQQIAL